MGLKQARRVEEGWRLHDMVTKGSVLVVDDEVNLCRILGAKLAKSGYSVVAVHDGMQAVEKVRESDFDVVLLDLILPKMDGLAALAEIRSLRSALPVIVMTACENPDALQAARSQGVSAYVNKPFDLDSLVSLVQATSRNRCDKTENRLPESSILFAKNQPVTLEVQNGGGLKVFDSRVYDKDDHSLSVVAPCVDGQAIDIPPRTCVRVGLAASDAYYSFVSHVIRCNNSPDHVFVLDKPSVIYRVQRRAHPRLHCRIPIRCAPFTEGGARESVFKRGETRDISEGGACLVVPDQVLPGEILKVELRPKTTKDVISAVAQVLRSKPRQEPGKKGCILGCRFSSVDASVRKLLQDWRAG